jgi:hypothetical protein
VSFDNFSDIVSALLYFSLDESLDQSAEGLLHLSCFVLLHLSSEREFSFQINKPFPNNRMASLLPPFFGTYADFLILVSTPIFPEACSNSLDILRNPEKTFRIQTVLDRRMFAHDHTQYFAIFGASDASDLQCPGGCLSILDNARPLPGDAPQAGPALARNLRLALAIPIQW